MRVLIAVTHLLGAGHLTRAAALARAFAAAGHEALLVSGGRPAPMVRPDGLQVVQLPPLHIAGTDFSRPLGPDGSPADAALFAQRRALLLDALEDFAPDAVITELFPFGRRALAAEFLALVEAAHARRPRPLILASVRDILVASAKPERIAQVHERVALLYDAVLVHGDPALVALDASWPLDPGTARTLRYTGYVDEGPAPVPHAMRRGVLVAAGSGPAGLGLLRAAADTARLQPGLGWRILAGHGLPEADLAALGRGLPDGAVGRARPDYRALLAGAALSVSQCGYNTAIDLLATATPAVLVPFEAGGETEQRLRAECLAGRGLARVLPEAALTADALLHAVNAQFQAPPPTPHGIDLGGAARTVDIVADLFLGHAIGQRHTLPNGAQVPSFEREGDTVRDAISPEEPGPSPQPFPARERGLVASGTGRSVSLAADADRSTGRTRALYPPPCVGDRILTSGLARRTQDEARVPSPERERDRVRDATSPDKLGPSPQPSPARERGRGASGTGKSVGLAADVDRSTRRTRALHPSPCAADRIHASGRARPTQDEARVPSPVRERDRVRDATSPDKLGPSPQPSPARERGRGAPDESRRENVVARKGGREIARSGFTVLRDALDEAAARGQRVPFWWRDDDAVAASPALDRLIARAEAHAVPLLLAAIPAGIEPSLGTRLASAGTVSVAIHGLAHHDHAPPAEKSAEFGAHRPLDVLMVEAAAGLRIARERLPDAALLPVFVPPWNRIAPTLAAALPGLGYRGLSSVPGPAIPGLVRFDATLDPIDWRGTRSLRDPDTLLCDLAASIARDPSRPIGLLTHHRVHDAAIWAFVADLLTGVRHHPAVTVLDPRILFSAAAVETGAAGSNVPGSPAARNG